MPGINVKTIIRFVGITPEKQTRMEFAVTLFLLFIHVSWACDIFYNMLISANIKKIFIFPLMSTVIEVIYVHSSDIYYRKRVYKTVEKILTYCAVNANFEYKIKKVCKIVVFVVICQCTAICTFPLMSNMVHWKISYTCLPGIHTQWTPKSMYQYVGRYLFEALSTITVLANGYSAILLHIAFMQCFENMQKDITCELSLIKQKTEETDLTRQDIACSGNISEAQVNLELITNVTGVCNDLQCEASYSHIVVKAIQHYGDIHRMYATLKPWYEQCVSFCLLRFVVTNCITLYFMSKEIEHGHVLIPLCIHNMLELFILNHIGEKMRNVNSEIQFAFYDTPWYTLPIEDKKMILVMTRILQQPITFKGFKIYTASMYIFGECIKMSYNYFNVLRCVLHK